MNSSIESLESRRFFSVATSDISTMVTDERPLPKIFSAATQQELAVRSALHTDLNRLQVFQPNAPALVALGRKEAADLRALKFDVFVFTSTVNGDSHSLLIRARNFHQHPNSSSIRADFGIALARIEQDEENNQRTLFNDASNASTGTAVTDFNAVAAAAPSDFILQSDVQSGIANLSASATALATAINLITNDAVTFVADSSNFQVFGNENLFASGYPIPANPFGGATVAGLAPNVTSVATIKFVAPATFTPAAGAYPGTDQIFVGSNKTPAAGQVAGPQVITVNYGALTKLASPIKTLTLGIATDGFENPTIHIPYTASINGVANPALTAVLNSLDDADRVEQFVSIGIDPAQLLATKVLTITIDGPGDGVSGWAVDFVTVGIQNG